MNVKKISAIVGAVLMAGVLSACGGSNDKRDLEGIRSMDPDYAEVYNNSDGRPNVGLLCIRGAGFATTTRDFTSIMRVSEWDDFCKGFQTHSIVESQMRKNGGE